MVKKILLNGVVFWILWVVSTEAAFIKQTLRFYTGIDSDERFKGTVSDVTVSFGREKPGKDYTFVTAEDLEGKIRDFCDTISEKTTTSKVSIYLEFINLNPSAVKNTLKPLLYSMLSRPTFFRRISNIQSEDEKNII